MRMNICFISLLLLSHSSICGFRICRMLWCSKVYYIWIHLHLYSRQKRWIILDHEIYHLSIILYIILRQTKWMYLDYVFLHPSIHPYTWFHFPKGIKHQFPVQTEGMKEEGFRVWWVDVSFGFLIGWFRRTQYITWIVLFYKNWRFYLEGVWLWKISGGGHSHNWVCEWPSTDLLKKVELMPSMLSWIFLK